MKGQLCRIFLFLSLAILVICLPAQAAHAGQSGLSSPMSDDGAQVPARSGTPDKSMQTGSLNTNAASSLLSDPSADSSGSSDLGTTGRTDSGHYVGSAKETGRDTSGRIPDSPGQSRGSGLMSGMMISPSGAAVAQFAAGSDNGYNPGTAAHRGPSPQRQQHGPPAHAGSYPCGPAQAAPLPPASGQTRDESKEDTPSRQRSRWTSLLSWILEPTVPDSASSSSSSPVQSLFPLNMLLFGGYRRISRKNVLEHEARQGIYHAVTERPGIDVNTLACMTGINENTLRYHLDWLVVTGKITFLARPGVVRYFQNQGTYSQYEHRVFHYLWTETPCRILWLLHQQPGLTRQHVADALAISGPSVTRQMDTLIEDRIVENRFPGRSNHYYLTAEAALTIDTLMIRIPVMMHSGVEVRPISATAG